MIENSKKKNTTTTSSRCVCVLESDSISFVEHMRKIAATAAAASIFLHCYDAQQPHQSVAIADTAKEKHSERRRDQHLWDTQWDFFNICTIEIEGYQIKLVPKIAFIIQSTHRLSHIIVGIVIQTVAQNMAGCIIWNSHQMGELYILHTIHLYIYSIYIIYILFLLSSISILLFYVYVCR